MTSAPRTKWGVYNAGQRMLAQSTNRDIWWTYDRTKAETRAERMGGKVVDVEEWIANEKKREVSNG